LLRFAIRYGAAIDEDITLLPMMMLRLILRLIAAGCYYDVYYAIFMPRYADISLLMLLIFQADTLTPLPCRCHYCHS